ncbi:dimethylhistidine N-methyltransferase [Methylobacterium sp. Leaf102]|nr:dimethylhistidine N-methyltransferase [Methylobacterium sp. Leaf102]
MTETVVDVSMAQADVLSNILQGLSEAQKRLPGKLLWDENGSDLFERICASVDYYPTRTEIALLTQVSAEIAPSIGSCVTIVEFGSGASRKIRTLLDALDRPARYIALDISGDYLDAAIAGLAPSYPGVHMIPVHADYTTPVHVPVDLSGTTVLGFFPGTSIGNFLPDDAKRFLERARATLGPSRFLVGADPTRDVASLMRAYGNADGLMPAFHINLLTRLNREFDADLDSDNFHHTVQVHHDPFRVEAHLVARTSAIYRLGGTAIRFRAGESILTDVSYKYSPDEFQALAREAGWYPERVWLDPQGLFSLHLLQT